jgi:hypothetical protein
MQSMTFPVRHGSPKDLLTRSVLILACLVTLSACSKSAENVLTGRGLDTSTHKPLEESSTFAAGEAFSIVLAPVQLKDTYLDLIVFSWGTNSRPYKIRTLTFKGLDMSQNWVQISNAFSIPFAGRYRISFEQLETVLGWADVTITPTPEAP